MNILALAQAEFPETLRLRRHFHENPELSCREVNTIAFLEAYLKDLGIPTINVPDGGLLGIIDSGKPGKTLLMRADTDALPIAESPENLKGPKVCLSQVPGVSHACGHDGHMAMLLTAARILVSHKEAFAGKVVLCFERGEEESGDIQNLLPYIVKESGLTIDGCYATHVRWDCRQGKCPSPPGRSDGRRLLLCDPAEGDLRPRSPAGPGQQSYGLLRRPVPAAERIPPAEGGSL